MITVMKKYPDRENKTEVVGGDLRYVPAVEFVERWGNGWERVSLQYRVTKREDSTLQLDISQYRSLVNRTSSTSIGVPLEAAVDVIRGLAKSLYEIHGINVMEGVC